MGIFTKSIEKCLAQLALVMNNNFPATNAHISSQRPTTLVLDFSPSIVWVLDFSLRKGWTIQEFTTDLSFGPNVTILEPVEARFAGKSLDEWETCDKIRDYLTFRLASAYRYTNFAGDSTYFPYLMHEEDQKFVEMADAHFTKYYDSLTLNLHVKLETVLMSFQLEHLINN